MTQLQQISSKNEYSFKSNVNALDTIEDLLVKDMCEAIIVSTQSVSLLLGSVVRKVNSGFHRMHGDGKTHIEVQHPRVKVTFCLINHYLVDSGIQLSDNRA